MHDIIIIGAGASGLMAARILSASGKKVLLLEARDRLGGRIETLTTGFSFPAETGAEFIHGNLKITLNLLKEAGITYTKTKGEIYSFENGALKSQQDFVSNWDVLSERLNKLTSDIAIADFLSKHLPEDEYRDLRKSFTKYVEGYDAADINNTSSFAIRDEMQEEEGEQYRVDGGYIGIINFLADKCYKNNCTIKLSEPVKRINWQKNRAEVVTEKGKYTAGKVIITVPPAILKMEAESEGAIEFNPSLSTHKEAIKQLGVGGVIKILLEFDEAFWFNKSLLDKNNKEPLFIFADTSVPTWWTQFPKKIPLITGWLSGPLATRYAALNEEKILTMSIESLSNIYKLDALLLKRKLKYYLIKNWLTEPYSRGAYSYPALMQKQAAETLRTPAKETIYFASEAIAPETIGTVESALISGKDAAEKILKAL